MAKILISEDERDIRDLVAFTLTYGGHEVVATSNGMEAVEIAPKEQPDLILMDVRMPKMTGYEACVELKKNPQTKDIPVVFLSAKGQEAEVQAGMGVGALDYILKPFAPDALLERIGELLEKASRLKAAAAEKAEAEPPKEAAAEAEAEPPKEAAAEAEAEPPKEATARAEAEPPKEAAAEKAEAEPPKEATAKAEAEPPKEAAAEKTEAEAKAGGEEKAEAKAEDKPAPDEAADKSGDAGGGKESEGNQPPPGA
jgi:DNA-binding response OmpR family regulator